jgi:4'-phosphopantetheinyl transferase
MALKINQLYFLPVTDRIDQEEFNIFLGLVSNEKQEQVRRYRFEIDRKLGLYGELLVRCIACRILGIKNTDVVFGREEYGKPYIKGYPYFYYNISHTRNALAVVVADNPVGVDIEKLREAEPGIAKRFFAADEQEYIDNADSEKDRRFYDIWTKKEAYIKYLGKGLSMPLHAFNSLNPDISARISTLQKDGYVISVCGKEPKIQFETIELCEKEMEEMALSLLSV